MRIWKGTPTTPQRWMALAALLLLGGCATHGAISVAPAPAPASYEPVKGTPSALAGFRLTRGFAGPETLLEPVPTAMLLLGEAAPANAKVCEAFLRVPPTSAVLEQSLVDPNLIVTRMPLTLQAPDASRLNDCSYLLSIYDFQRAQAWKARLGITATNAPVFVVIFPMDGVGSTPFLALDTSTLGDAELGGVVEKWLSALTLASTELRHPVQPSSPAINAPALTACDTVGETVRVVSPVLIAMGAAALIAEYPAVTLVIGSFTARDPTGSVVTHFKKSISSLSDYLGNLTTKGCKGLINAIRARILGNRSDTSAP